MPERIFSTHHICDDKPSSCNCQPDHSSAQELKDAVETPLGPPRHRVTTEDEDLQIVPAVAEQPKTVVREAQADLRLKHVSATTMKRHLYETGLESRTTARKPSIRPVNKAKRFQFAEYHAHWSASD
ncbi:hypothetical protein MRX96_009976 [Rhipicephalus microplus]